LPSEAQWEYSCRAGATSTEPYHFGTVLDDCRTQANFDGRYPYGSNRKFKSPRRTMPVGSYPPNAFGLYDMHGNIWEWCSDWYAEDYYATGPTTEPLNETESEYRVLRGGCWDLHAAFSRSASRVRNAPTHRYHGYGFRVAADWSP
jgi:formylglycine-generating enzyme required for sulfatase activity